MLQLHASACSERAQHHNIAQTLQTTYPHSHGRAIIAVNAHVAATSHGQEIATLQKTNIIRDFLEDIEEEPAPRSEPGLSVQALQLTCKRIINNNDDKACQLIVSQVPTRRMCKGMCLPISAQHILCCVITSKAAADDTSSSYFDTRQNRFSCVTGCFGPKRFGGCMQTL